MKEIPLTQGKMAIVDDADHDRLIAMGPWCLQARGCAETRSEGRMVKMHRVIMGAPAGMEVDHQNHDTLDNRRSNLRLCTRSQNMANRRKQSGTSSRFKGVYRNKQAKRWMAHIQINGRKKNLGYFDDEEEAARAYNVAALKHFGEFALLNDIRGGGLIAYLKEVGDWNEEM